MSLKSFIVILIGLSLFFGGQIAYGMESVRVVSNPDEAKTAYSVSYSGDKSPIIALDISAISVANVNLDSKELQQASVAGGERYTVGELSEDGRPDLPAVTSLFIIPDQAGLSLSVSYSGYDEIENIDLAPVQPSPLESQADQVIPFTKDETIYSQNSFYPGELAQIGEPFIMRDIRAAQVSIYPLQYNPVSKTLRVYRDLSVQISYDGEVVNPRTHSRPYISEAFYPVYKSLFANFDEIFTEAQIQRGGYLIIAKEALVDSLQTIADWKHQKGYTARIVPTTEINVNGLPTMTQIYNYIHNAYNTWETPPEYVLLVGDADGTMQVAQYPYQSYPSDQRYGCVDGNDYIPDIFVGRLSVDNILQYRIASSKIIKYDKTPFMGDPSYWTRALAVGYNYFNTARLMPLWVRQLALRHGYTQVDTIIQTTHNPNLVNYYRDGLGLSWYRGVAGDDGWWGPNFLINDLIALPSNQKLGVVVPITCALADFANNECFGEYWIRMGANPDSLKGGPSFYSSSDHFSHTKWNNPNIIGFFWGLFEQGASHMGSAALCGKMQIYRTFPRYIGNGDIVETYFMTYNILGDPETEIRTKVPKYLVVDNPNLQRLGINHLDVTVSDSSGNPVPDAFVTLIKTLHGEDEVFSVAQTDESGIASLSFGEATRGSLFITVTGRDLYPYQDEMGILSDITTIAYQSLAIDDDAIGYSSGNGDSLANPGETLELFPTVENYGDRENALGVSVTISAIDSNSVDIYQATQYYGDIALGERRSCVSPFVIKLSPDLQDGTELRILMNASDTAGNSWLSEFTIPISAPRLTIGAVNINGSNNYLNARDSSQIVVTLQNSGTIPVNSVMASLQSDDDFIAVYRGSFEYGNILPDSSSSNLVMPFLVEVADGAFNGRVVNFRLIGTTSTGYNFSIPFQAVVGTIGTRDPTGPDSYGYYAYDSYDTSYAGYAVYNWVELAPGLGGPGQNIDFDGNRDDNSVRVELPFDFKYYGETYRSLIVCTNGFVSPDTETMDMQGNYWSGFYNLPIPDPSNARAQISPLWDDLSISVSSAYGVFNWYDSTGHRYIIEYNHAQNRNTSAIATFELIIYDSDYYPTLTGDDEMQVNYAAFNDLEDYESYSSIGIENWAQDIGLQYLYDHTPSPGARVPAQHSNAIKFTTNTGLAGIRGTVDLVGSDSDVGATVRVLGGPRRVTSDSGAYWITNIIPGSVDIIAEAPGYLPQYQFDVIAMGNQTIPNVDFELQPCPIPSGLTASDSLSGRIELNWTPVDQPNLAGYYVYRSHWQSNGYEKITVNPISETHYFDTSIPDTSVYWYYISAIYTNNQWVSESFNSQQDNGRALPVSIAGGNLQIPTQYFLSQNFPNPFNPTTSIGYGLPQNCHVKLDIFNLLGQKVATLIDSDQSAGYKTVIWEGKTSDGHEVSSGIYLYKLTAGKREFSRKLTLLK